MKDNKLANTKKPNILIGLAIFCLEIMAVILIIRPIRERFGLWASIGTQTIILACAILPAILLKWDLREVFPVKKPMVRQIFSVIILWVNFLGLMLLANWIIMYFSPQMSDALESIDDLMVSVSFPAAFILTVVLPVICEELLHRGLILHTFQNIKNKWITVAVMGVIFGAFHLNWGQLVGTAIMGAFMACIMLETKNILLPMLFHFLNNSFKLYTLTLPTSESTTLGAYDSETAFMVGLFFIFCSMVPFLLVWGSRLLRTKEYNRKNKLNKTTRRVAVLSAAVSLSIGICVIILR